jgi:rRNA biogenesis protein RRP5
LKEELKIRNKEEATTKFDNKESVEFYEKQILSEPNSSIFWIQYAAYILDKLGMAAARKILERAIATINISLVKEKLNVWIAYMNLENTYGNADTFKSAVERALLVNEKKTVYKHLISIYKLSGKFDLAYEVYKIILKNFFSDMMIWKNYMEFLFEVDAEKQKQTNPDLKSKFESLFPEPKEGLNKAMQVLGKNKHVDLLVYFAGLQYKYEYLEEARNTFESILRNFPKRSDIWIVYLDKEIKHGKNLVKIRSTFEKALYVDFKIKVLKTLMKKYLEFEKDFGTPKTLEHVKTLTAKIISEKMSQLRTEDDGEGDNNEQGNMDVDDE